MKQYDPNCLYPLPFHILLLAIFFSITNFSILQAYGNLSNETDRHALLQIKRGISSDPYGVLNSWNVSNQFCNWFGVSCGRRHQRVVSLVLEGQNLKGLLSPYVGNLSFLRVLDVQNNSLHGQIPSEIGNLFRLKHLILGNNSLHGEIPSNLSICSRLKTVILQYNNLIGEIPHWFGNLANVELFALGANNLTGKIPVSLGNLSSLVQFSLGGNNLVGNIPDELGRLNKLTFFSVSGNSFQGKIPSSLSSLKGLQYLDLSRNNFSGEIPPNLQNLTFVQYLNLSFNDLEGEVPSTGIFRNVSLFSVAANEKICGGLPELGLPKCFTNPTHHEKKVAKKLVGITTSVGLFVVLVSAIVIVYLKRRPLRSNPVGPSLLTEPHVEVSYQDLHRSTNGFSSDNLIGSGTFGLVYKGFLNQLERYVAIKVLKLEEKGASKSFIAECKALRSVRHRNLVKVLTYCSSLDHAGNEFKALIFEFMANGSLENLPRSLNFVQRLDITIDVASALHYLHDLCEGPIIHCDLKANNILLDDNFVAHLSDFGLAKIFFSINDGSQSQISSIGMKGTIGYAPPEYELGGIASKEGDIYSFGILVLELLSGKNPTHYMFRDGLNLHDFVKNKLPQSLWEVMDPSMLPGETEQEARTTTITSVIDRTGKLKESLLSVFKVGLACSTPNPTERQKIGDVVKELHLIKSTFLGTQIYG